MIFSFYNAVVLASYDLQEKNKPEHASSDNKLNPDAKPFVPHGQSFGHRAPKSVHVEPELPKAIPASALLKAEENLKELEAVSTFNIKYHNFRNKKS